MNQTGLSRREAEGLIYLQKWATDKDADGGLVTLAQGQFSDAAEGKTTYAKGAKEHKRHVEAAQAGSTDVSNETTTEPHGTESEAAKPRQIIKECECCNGTGRVLAIE